MSEEAAPFRRLAQGRAGVDILVTGIGPVNSRRALLAKLSQGNPTAVLTCGYAGGLNPALRTAEVVFSCDESLGLRERLLAAGAREGRFHCSERVVTTAAEKRVLRVTCGADAVEMESGPIRQVCCDRGLPAATVRVISDPADQDLPLDFNRLLTPDQRLDYAKLAGTILKSPARAAALLRLRKQTRLAGQALARVLAAVAVSRRDTLP
jgi:nucleoside phosphorylase